MDGDYSCVVIIPGGGLGDLGHGVRWKVSVELLLSLGGDKESCNLLQKEGKNDYLLMVVEDVSFIKMY